MKVYKVFRWFLKASALTGVMFLMQACYGSPFSLEMHGLSKGNSVSEGDTLVSEDLQLVGMDNEDWQSADDPIVP